MVDLIFPVINGKYFILSDLLIDFELIESIAVAITEEYNDLNYWKLKIDSNVDFTNFF